MSQIWLGLLDASRLNFHTVVGCLVILAILAITSRRYTNQKIKSVPGPGGGHFLWGHELEVFSSACGSKYTEWLNEYGPVCRIKGALFHTDLLVIADRAAINHILTTNAYNYVKTPFMRPFVERTVGRGVVWAERTLHKRFRRLMDNVFSAANVREMAPDVFDVSSKLCVRLSQCLQANDGDAVINIRQWTAAATLDVIGRVGFGYDFDGGLSPEAKEIESAWTATVNTGMSTKAFYAEVLVRAFPFLLSLPVKAMQAQGRIKVITNKLAHKMLQSTESENAPDHMGECKGGKNFLDSMMSATGEGKMTLEETIDNLSTLIIAGYDTTAGTLNLILHALARHPDCQQKLRDELVALGREPTYEDFTNAGRLPYLDAVLKEGLRLYPAGTNNGRAAEAEDVIPLETPIVTSSGKILKELHIDAGQIIYIPHMSIHKIKSVWEDGEVFRPERWIEPDGLPPKSKLQQGWSNILTFNAGPRSCLGYKLALLESKSILAVLIRNFVFHDTGVEIETKFVGTLHARVVGREDEGVQLPLRVTLV